MPRSRRPLNISHVDALALTTPFVPFASDCSAWGGKTSFSATRRARKNTTDFDGLGTKPYHIMETEQHWSLVGRTEEVVAAGGCIGLTLTRAPLKWSMISGTRIVKANTKTRQESSPQIKFKQDSGDVSIYFSNSYLAREPLQSISSRVPPDPTPPVSAPFARFSFLHTERVRAAAGGVVLGFVAVAVAVAVAAASRLLADAVDRRRRWYPWPRSGASTSPSLRCPIAASAASAASAPPACSFTGDTATITATAAPSRRKVELLSSAGVAVAVALAEATGRPQRPDKASYFEKWKVVRHHGVP